MKVLMMGLTPPLEGGSQRHIYEISERISEVEVLTQKDSISERKIELPVLKINSFLRNVSFFAVSLFYSIYLTIAIKKKYDIIHIHENLLYFLIPLLSIRYKVVVTIHGIKGFKFFEKRYFWIFFKQPLKLAGKLIAVNLEDEAKLKKEFKRVVYVPNGVDLSIYRNVKEKHQSKITFIGRIHKQKGIIYLLEAFEEISSRLPEFKLEIIGELNDYSRELKKKFKNKNILWRGYLGEREEIVKILKSSYCIVLPSLWEGLPLTLFESLASGRPLILSDIPAFKSVINNEAMFFEVKNSKDLAQKILKMVKDKKLSKKYALYGKKLSQKYDWDNISNQTKKIYSKLMK